MDIVCQKDFRRDAVRATVGRNGLDYVEVEEGAQGTQPKLRVFFLGKAPQEFTAKNGGLQGYLKLTGGERITGLVITSVTLVPGNDAEHDDCLVVTLDRIGDFSSYMLTLVNVQNIDPQYVSAPFRFRIDCASDLDCKTPCFCEPQQLPEPRLNYLAKDYTSFRQLIFDRMALLVPGWTERHVPDLGVTLVELLAYVGDQLSYYQDAVATEAYLATARQRISVRRHARLIDYRLHEGCNARTWVYVRATGTFSLPASRMGFATQMIDVNGVLPTVVDVIRLQGVPASSYEYFEPLLPNANTTVEFREAHNRISIYTWGRRLCCLEKGTTSATLLDGWLNTEGNDRALNVVEGDVLILQEVIGPRTGNPADADPTKRWAVRVINVTLGEDPLYPVQIQDGELSVSRPTPLVTVTWSVEDALPHDFCLSTLSDAPACQGLSDVTIVKGNIIPVDHGRTIGPEPLGTVPGVTTPACCECEGEPSDVMLSPGRFRPRLQQTPITYRDPADPSALPAATALSQDPRLALPDATLGQYWANANTSVKTHIRDWSARLDLLESGADDAGFVVEVDNDGIGHLRFGDGFIARAPDAGSEFEAQYRVGCGVAGNVAAESICHLVLIDFKVDGGVEAICNPLAAAGGIDPESMAEAKMFAPGSFRNPQAIQRAITAADYALLAQRDNAKLQDASASLAWTGSWYEADVSVDPWHSETADDALLGEVARDLERYRRMGHDLRVLQAVYVPIDLELAVCALPGYDTGHIKAALLTRFSNRVNRDGSLGFFHPDNLELGEDVYLSAIVAAAQAVPGVQCVTVMTFQRYLEPSRGEIAAGCLAIAANEIAQLDNDPDFPEHGHLDITVGGGR